MNKIDLSKFNIRTDLIIEDKNIIQHEEIINGIKISQCTDNGNYITISFDDITDTDNRVKVGNCLVKVLKDLLTLNKIKDSDNCLVIGLGNVKSTPDSLGVKVLDNITVTSHLLKFGSLDKGMRIVSAFSPSVMANTGIESGKIILSLVKEIRPDFIIAIDALATSDIDRLNKTIQVTDTGIHPGSGIGNNRMEISMDTIGIPVIAIGVPTVVLSSVIVYDTINYLYKHVSYIKENDSLNKLSYHHYDYKTKLKDKDLSCQDKANLLGLFGSLSDNEQKILIDEVLNKLNLNLIVTPTEIDFLIDKLSELISSSINRSLHRQITHY